MSLIYYYHANPIGNSDKEQFHVSPNVIPYDYNHTTYFSDRIYHSRNLNSRFYVITFGYQVGWSNASVTNRVCNRYTVHFVFEGFAHFNGRLVRQNDIYIAMPNEKHTISIRTENGMIHGWVALSGRELESMIDIHHLPKEPIFHISSEQMNQIRSLFLETIYRDHSDRYMPHYLFAQFFQALAIAALPLPPPPEINNVYINRSLEFINDNYSKNISITDIAKAVNISGSYMRKLFAKELQTSPQAVITNKRISVAKHLLEDPSVQIYIIAEMCGFSDQSAFSKTFKKYVGLSPMDYRKEKLATLLPPSGSSPE